jgi:sulfate transport system substrate-binding protein
VHDKAVIEKHKDIYPDVRLVTVEDVFGGWDKLQKEHFAEGGVLDQLFTKK